MKNETAAIVVTYNRKELLTENIEALLRQQGAAADIFVIDNFSTDGTGISLKPYLIQNKIRYFNTGKNLGGAGGFQYGIRAAMREGYRYLWIMDDDTIPEPDALAALLKGAQQLKDCFSFLCSVVHWKDGTFCKMNLPVLKENWFDCLREGCEGLLAVSSCSFVSCLINADCIKKAGLPFAEFFIYGDDAEYTERLSYTAAGYMVLSSFVQHKTEKNISDDLSKEDAERIGRYFYRYRNCFYNAKRKGWRSAGLYLYTGGKMLIKILLLSRGNRRKRMGMLVKGIAAGFRFHPEIQYPE